MTFEEKRDRMLAACRHHMAVWFSFKEGDNAVEFLSKMKAPSERMQFGIRLILMMVIPKMTKETHRLSEFKEDLPLLINAAPEIVRAVLTEQHDFIFGYHSVDVLYTFDQIKWRSNYEKTEGREKG